MADQKEVAAPPTFKAGGRVYTIDLNLGLIDSVLAATQLDLAPDNGDYHEVSLLLLNPRKLGNVLWACCNAQADSNGVDRDAFLAALDKDALTNGWGALADAVVFFTPNKIVANQAAEMIEAQVRMIEAQAKEVAKSFSSPEVAKAMQEVIEEQGASLREGIREEFDKSVTSSPESSVSIRGRTRFAS
jgi:hypothetical protein